MQMRKMSPAVRWFLILLLTGLVLWGAPFLYDGWVKGGMMLYVMSMYVLAPLLSAVLPYLGGTRGLHPMAGFFPIGLALLLSVHGRHGGMSIALMGVSLVACVAGNEVKKRRETCGGNKVDRKK